MNTITILLEYPDLFIGLSYHALKDKLKAAGFIQIAKSITRKEYKLYKLYTRVY